MENVFNYLKSNDSFADISKYIEEAQKYRITDPQASIIKISNVLEIVVNRLVEQENSVKFSGSDLNTKINSLKSIILDRVISDMHSIRSIRNTSAAHVSYSTTVIQADKIDSLFCLKKIYDILAWYLNYNASKKTVFSTFDDYFEYIQPEQNKILEPSLDLVSLPKFFIDYEFQVSFKGKSVEDLDESDVLKVFTLFFTTKSDLKTIERLVFHNDRADGYIVYAIISLYKMIGLTNSWRKFIQEFGVAGSISMINKYQTIEKNIEIKHKLSVLEQVLKSCA